MTRDLILDLLGIPFVFGGTSKRGADCRWLSIQAAAAFGRYLADPWDDVAGRWSELTSEDIAEIIPYGWVEVDVDKAEPGDLFLLRITDEEMDALCHLTILVEPGLMLTTCRGGTSRLERITPAVRDRIHACWRLPSC